jgi:hydroxymethylbilane synthase
MRLSLSIGARGSKLSRIQVEEVYQELRCFYPDTTFHPIWITTTGDTDLTTSLRTLEKTDFFTREIDERQLQGEFRIAIHSAKDLPDPLPEGLQIVALTRGQDPSDVLVYHHELPLGARIGTSSLRREHNLLQWRSDLVCVDIRGTIGDRLALLETGQLDGVVVAKAALIRLGLNHHKQLPLTGEVSPLQGRLAVVARQEDQEMEQFFRCINDFVSRN